MTRELDDVFRDVFRGSDAIAAGILTPGRLRGPEFERLFRDVYVRASTRVTHELRCRAASLALPNGAAITGRSAATVRGVRTAWPEDPVEILAPELGWDVVFVTAPLLRDPRRMVRTVSQALNG
jgi:hypothetical protein